MGSLGFPIHDSNGAKRCRLSKPTRTISTLEEKSFAGTSARYKFGIADVLCRKLQVGNVVSSGNFTFEPLAENIISTVFGSLSRRLMFFVYETRINGS